MSRSLTNMGVRQGTAKGFPRLSPSGGQRAAQGAHSTRQGAAIVRQFEAEPIEEPLGMNDGDGAGPVSGSWARLAADAEIVGEPPVLGGRGGVISRTRARGRRFRDAAYCDPF